MSILKNKKMFIFIGCVMWSLGCYGGIRIFGIPIAATIIFSMIVVLLVAFMWYLILIVDHINSEKKKLKEDADYAIDVLLKDIWELKQLNVPEILILHVISLIREVVVKAKRSQISDVEIIGEMENF